MPDAATLIARLAKLGNGDPEAGFRSLCIRLQICSLCCEPWDQYCECSCIRRVTEAVAL